MTNKVTVRRAHAGDAADLAVLLDIASYGLVAWAWNRMAEPGASPIEFGRNRILSHKGLPSYHENWSLAEYAGVTAGGMGGYPIPDPYDPGDIRDLPDVYIPLLELELLASGSWHLTALAVYREYRNLGIGSIFLDEAEKRALDEGCRLISIIVHATNNSAQRLYRRKGFSLVDRRMAHPFAGTPESEWLLFQKLLT